MLKKSLHQRCHFVPRNPNSSEVYLLYGRENTIKLCEKNYTFQGIKSLVSSLTQRDREEKVLFSEMINRVLGSHQTSVDITKGTFSCGWTPRAKLM